MSIRGEDGENRWGGEKRFLRGKIRKVKRRAAWAFPDELIHE